MSHRFSAAALVAIALSGCEAASTAARRDFGREYSCPEDRVEVRPRPDIKWSTVAFVDTRGTPSDEVKNDPARYAKWNKDQDQLFAPLIKVLDSYDVFEATGCAHDMLVGCKRPAKSNGTSNPFICSVAPLPKNQ